MANSCIYYVYLNVISIVKGMLTSEKSENRSYSFVWAYMQKCVSLGYFSVCASLRGGPLVKGPTKNNKLSFSLNNAVKMQKLCTGLGVLFSIS